MTAVRTGVTAVAAPATVAGHVPRAVLIARLAVLLVLVYTVAPGVAAAANVNATWNGGAGNWNSTGNWSGGVVPNNGGGNTFSVFIDGGKAGNSLVTLDINPTITNLTIDRGDELRQPTGLGFAVVNGMVTNSGTFSMKAAGNNTDLTCAASTFAGPGTLLLSNDTGNRIFTGNTVCTNAQDHTIRGSGQLLVDSGGMSNAGTIIADQSNPLIIDPNGMGLTNTGTLEALNGGTLILQSALFTNANGNIQALDTSLVRLIGVSVAGGTLGTTGSGSINIESGSVLADFTNTGGLVLPNGQAGTISGTLTNNGTLSLQAAGNNTDLTCFGGATFGGTGSMVLSNDPHNRIFTNNTQCINSTDHTIRGAGQLLVDSGGMLNQGTIIADQSTALVIDPNATGFTNASILQAQDGGKLLLVSGPFANAGGVINALNGSEVDLSAVSVSGGQLVTAGSGTIEVSAGTVLSNVTSNGAVEQATGATGFISGTFTNHGTYALSAAGNNTDLTCKGMATFAGDGSLVLSNDTRNRIFTDNTLCTNAAGHTIHGSGQLLADSGGMLNQGTIIADQPTPLVIDPNGLGFTNASLLQAQNGATLVLASGTFTNTNAVVKALEASEVDLNAIGISGGQLLTSGSGKIEVLNGTVLSNLTSNAAIEQKTGTTGFVTGTVTNNGIYALNAAGNNTDLTCLGTATLTGTGSLLLSDDPRNRIFTDNTVCTNAAGQTIHGAGQLLVDSGGMKNLGTITADKMNSLVIDPNAQGFVNMGTLQAQNAATLVLQAGTFTNTGAVIQAVDDMSAVRIIGALVDGGTVTSNGAGAAISVESGSTLHDVTNTGAVVMATGQSGSITGTLTNNGTFSMNAAGNNTDLTCAAATLTGAGTLLLDNDFHNRIFTANTVCTNSQGHTIRGAGQLLVDSGAMSNAGTIIADQSNSLTIDPNATGFTNTGTLEAMNGGTLILQSGGFTNTNGIVQALDTSMVRVIAATISDGTLNTSGSGSISIESGSVLADVTNNGALVLPTGQTATITGTLTNTGTFSMNAAGNNTDLGCAAATLAGSGTLLLSNDPRNRIFTGNTQCTNGTNHKIRGAGQLLVDSGGMLNQGTITADQSNALFIDPNALGFTNQGVLRATAIGGMGIGPGPFTTSGTVVVDAGSSLTRSGPYTQTAGKTTVNGTLNATELVDIQGGILDGAGTVAANVSNAGQVDPGTSPGLLTITGAYAQSATGALNFEIGGPTVGTDYDRLAISGAATLDGTVNISLVNNFAPTLGSMFTVMTFASHVNDFATYNGLMQSNGVVFSKTLTAKSLILEVVSEAFTPTPTTTGARSPTPTATITPTLTVAVTATSTATRTAVPTGTPSSTPTSSRTSTRTPTVTATVTGTQAATATLTVTPTNTATSTATTASTATPTPSATPTATAATSTPTATATATTTGSPNQVALVGQVLVPGSGGPPGSHGQVPLGNVEVDLFLCVVRQPCLPMGEPVASVFAAPNGRFTILIGADLLQDKLPVVSARVSPTLVLRAPVVVVAAGAAGGSGGGLHPRQVSPVSETVIDVISEAAVQLLEEQGFQNYNEAGVAAVVQAVESANADSNFAEMTVEAAVEEAQTTAAADPAVQMALEDNKLPPPCVGDCDDNGAVTVQEVIKGVDIALGSATLDTCRQADADGSGTVTVNELLLAVNNALTGCH